MARSGAATRAIGSAVVTDLAAEGDEDRLIVVDEADDVDAGDVVGRHYHDAVPRSDVVAVDAEEAGMGFGGAEGAAEPRAREDEIVGVQRLAGQLARALAAERSRPDAARRSGRRG